jgi:aryl-alcohol dehydrogenase-like predicted oxidoreductase
MTLDYRYLGRSGLKVSRLALGTMMFGGQTDERTSHRIIDTAFEQGINFIDTADVYNGGESEVVVGRGIKARRDDWVLATKFSNPVAPGPNGGGQSRKWIIRSVEDSLRRLGTDYIDLLYFHRAVFDAPLGEAVRAISDLIGQGKLRYFGVSNFRAWRIAEVAHLADQFGIDRPIASQPLYNIFNRVAEVEQLPAADFYGLGTVSYSPLARGVLTGKYRSNQPQANPGNRMATGIGRARRHDSGTRPSARDRADCFRNRLGAEQRTGHEYDYRSTYRSALGKLHPCARRETLDRRRSADQCAGHNRPRFDARIQRSGPSG